MGNFKLLEEMIIGRVEPHIYAFTTNTVPNYLKVGDTYRPVSIRLGEWRRYFPNLKEEFNDKAIVNTEIFFRDYSVHQYLENELGKKRLSVDEIADGVYFSMEFFKETKTIDVKNAIADIKESYDSSKNKYQYYNADTRLPETYTYASTGMWELRPNQAEVVQNFKVAVDKGRKHLLMYAVMRFGKSFTSLCCAKEMNAKIVLVVSAKADVKEEWKKTVQSADNFNKEYIFLSSEELACDNNIVNKTLASSKGVVIFLTLQDLQGELIKNKHEELFGRTIDLLIVDETHYGARAEKYGQVLKSVNYDKDVKDRHISEDFVEIEDATNQIKIFNVNITLHLSGTPYRILMGSEFTKEDIITFCQFSDILKAQEDWDNEHILDDKEKEWNNPYYGFPQMIRFAFNPSASALQRLETLKNSGKTYAFSALFKPKSVSKATDGSHKKFIFEHEVLELFEVIDGSKVDEGLLGFLDYEKIKDGKMCRHIVCVLPYCASCDALEVLLTCNSEKFKNLNQYTIVNISGIDKPNEYNSIQAVKNKIKQCEDENKKTITLTVNRMLTGSTIEHWDTMIFFKDTASPQEYDQAIFRLQNQYIKKFSDKNGEEIKYNMKPQTLLVDFEPHRMFSMQEQKSRIYNANTDIGGNKQLKERIAEELRISPIIAINKNSIKKVEATDILSAVSAYSSSRGVLDETRDIPVDLSLLGVIEIRQEIERQAELGSKQGLKVEAHKGDVTDLELPDDGRNQDDSSEKGNEGETRTNTNSNSSDTSDIEKLENKFRTYYSRLLCFSFLTKDRVSSLDEIISCMGSEDNSRIVANLNLKKNILELLKLKMNVFILSQLDYKIQNINTLANDTTLEPIQRALTAINKFGKLSVSEITTPEKMCNDMVALLPDSCFNEIKKENHAILDIASKAGEYAIAICNKCKYLGIDIEQIKDSVLSIPTSSVAYEFTRKIYEVLGLNTDCIARKFMAYDLLGIIEQNSSGQPSGKIDYKKVSKILSQIKPFNKINLNEEVEEGGKMKFEAIVGNPPYQESDGGAGTSAGALYDKFVIQAKKMNPEYISMLIPSRWFTGGKGLDSFRSMMLSDRHIHKIVDYENYRDIFPQLGGLAGGACYFLRHNKVEGQCEVINCSTDDKTAMTRTLSEYDIFIRQNKAISILRKVQNSFKGSYLNERVSSRKPFSLPTNYAPQETGIPCWFIQKIGLKYAKQEDVKDSNNCLSKWKLLAPKAPIAGQTDFSQPVAFYYESNTIIAKPNECCTESFIVLGAFDTEKEVNSFKSYVFTKTVRFLLMQTVVSQDVTKKCFRFVPDLRKYSGTYNDKTLCNMWGLSEDDLEYIDSRIR